MPTRTAEATWNGRLKDGDGTMALGSGAFEGPYSFGSRFEDAEGTNPEELIGAAEAGCFAMATALALEEEGFDPERVHAETEVHLERVEGDFTITKIDLTAEGTVPDATEEEFVEVAMDAKENCPVSKALAATDIELTASLAE
ncbi:OsmC family protein [Haloarculaceae archaeon H-GB2-1]|nr:OsmC family protein [Haloarculaceae archaeon H-GB1-1]MEA5386980.1 OsmC family protein [Haloarculaceae archaeon H-GB11]MEA5408482.1 OsmC family protein [Haloarculaceae archaeon H-GB2-1]